MSSQQINKRALNGTDAPMDVAVKIDDKPDPYCSASLIDTDFVCTPFPLSANEPTKITTMPAMNYPNANQEDMTPNAFRPLPQQHSFAPFVRAYYATDATACSGPPASSPSPVVAGSRRCAILTCHVVETSSQTT